MYHNGTRRTVRAHCMRVLHILPSRHAGLVDVVLFGVEAES